MQSIKNSFFRFVSLTRLEHFRRLLFFTGGAIEVFNQVLCLDVAELND